MSPTSYQTAPPRIRRVRIIGRWVFRVNAFADPCRYWCRREDSNLHELSLTTTSRLRVYQFHHFGWEKTEPGQASGTSESTGLPGAVNFVSGAAFCCVGSGCDC